jgi:hypothetical protein
VCGRLRASFELTIVKAFVSHFGLQPRSTKKGVGLITSSTQVSEYVWEHAAHPYIDASACVWPKSLKRIRGKIPWANVDDEGSTHKIPSCLEYKFLTLVSMDRLIDTRKLMVPCPRSAEHHAQCPFPYGSAASVFVPRWLIHESFDSEDLPVVVKSGDPCCILGVRCTPLKTRTDSDCRWSGSVFEALVFFPHYHWLAWVDQCQINFKYPVSISYNRLHHRAVESTQTGSLNQEKVMVRFRQQIVDVRVIALGLKIAKANRCL